MRPLVVISIAVFVVLMVAMFLVKHEVRGIEREHALLELDRQRHVEAIRVLRSEWSYLTRPARIADLAARHLPLGQVQASQLHWLPRAPDAPTALVMPIGMETGR